MYIQKTTLSYQDERSDKLYEVEMVYQGWESYLVNFAYGRKGSKLKTGTKTENPVTFKEAERIFNDLVESKKDKGYKYVENRRKRLLEISLPDRQSIVDEIRNKQVKDVLAEFEKVGLDKQKHLVELDLSNLDFSNADLSNCNLSKTNLVGANLTGVNFQNCILEESQIDKTTKIEPKLRLFWELVNSGGENRDLQGVDLSNIQIIINSSFPEVNLTNANLKNANLSQSNLSNFICSNANLKNANLSGASCPLCLDNSCLENANLSGTFHNEARFKNTVCVGANFSRACFDGEFIYFENADCRNTNFTEANLTGGIISGANFAGANFTGATGLDEFLGWMREHEISEPVNFQNTNFSQTDLSGFDIHEVVYNLTDKIQLINWKGAIFNEVNLENANLSGLDLRYCSFVKANLKGANLENCNLAYVDFAEANLEGTNLTGANIKGVVLEGSKIDESTEIDIKYRLLWEFFHLGGENRDLRAVNLSGIEINFIENQDTQIILSGANLEGANLSQAELYNFDFSNANLKNADLSNSEFSFLDGACLNGANLTNTKFDEGSFRNTSCIKANFSRASFGGEWVSFGNSNCSNANFQEARFPFASINGANFSNANFSGARYLYNFFAGSYEEPLTEEVNFQNANLSKTDLRDVNFALIKLINLKFVRFNEANLENANLSGLDLSCCSFVKANLKGANLENCNLNYVDLTEANLEDANLKGIDLSKIISAASIRINQNTQVDNRWKDIIDN